MYVRLSAEWADPAGSRHVAGDVVDIDVVTLARLEEQGVVENADDNVEATWVGPGVEQTGTLPPSWVGPGDEAESPDDADAPDADEETSEG